MPVIVMMGPDTFKVLQNEPRDQLIQASMEDYQRAIDAGQATPWREPQQFTYSQPLPPSTPTYNGQPLYPMGGNTVGQSTGGGGYSRQGTGYGGGQLDYSPSFGAPPIYPPAQPTPLRPDMMPAPVPEGQTFGAAPQDPSLFAGWRREDPMMESVRSMYPLNNAAPDLRPYAPRPMQPLPWNMQQPMTVQPLPWQNASVYEKPIEIQPLPWR